MSNAAFLPQDYELDDCQFEHILGQLEQQRPLREQVANALKEANAAFAAQCTQPDGYTYMQTCDDLATFLDLKIPLGHTEQKSLVSVLQIACAMHENAVNNPALTPTQRSAHYLATTSLVRLCESALEGSVTVTELWCDAFTLCHRAEQALAKATDALDLSKYLDFGKMTDDHLYGFGSDGGQRSVAPSPAPTASQPATPRGSVHDITADVCLASRSTKLKHKALAMMNDRPYTGKVAPLGRRHTMPSLSQTTSSPYSRPAAGRPSLNLKAHSRGHGLNALQETEE